MHILNRTPKIEDLQSFNPNCKGILWDMDGTIMETEALHIKSTQELLVISHPKDKNLPSSQEIENICYGQTDPLILKSFQNLNFFADMTLSQFISQKNSLIDNMLKKLTNNQEIFNEDIRQFIGAVSKSGLKQVVVTSSERDITKILLKHLNLIDFFDFIITREDTLENKPSPQPYTTAMKQLGLSPEMVVIFEDSELGLKAASKSLAPYCKAQWYANRAL